MNINELLKSKKIIVCVGTGGVGKTTTSAILSYKAYQQGLKVLVITVDPSQRLAQALGIDRSSSEPTEIESDESGHYLKGVVVHAPSIFDDFLKETMPDEEKIERMKKNRLYVQLKTRLSGSQEFTALELLHRNVISEEYDLVVVDTPPAQNAIDFLEAPKKLHALFDSSVTKWFLNTSSETGFFKKLVASGSEKVFSALKTLTGQEFISELQEFFQLAQSWQHHLSQRMVAVQKMMTREDALFLLVTSASTAKLNEALAFEKELKREGYPMEAAIVNKTYPDWFHQELKTEKYSENLLAQHKEMKKFYQQRESIIENFVNRSDSEATFKLPEFDQDVSRLEVIKNFSSYLT